MTSARADVVICGAGIAGVATAYHLAVRRGVTGVVLVDEREPLSLTSSKGTGGYRNWWPGPDDAMVRLMNRSIALMEELARESGDTFRMNRRGYAFFTAEARGVAEMRSTAAAVAALGAGSLREHTAGSSFADSRADGGTTARSGLPDDDGADLTLDRAAIRDALPFITPDAVAALHVRRAGTFDPLRFGAWLLERVRAAGVDVVRARVDGIDVASGRVRGVRLAGGGAIESPRVVLAPGPHLARVGGALGLEIPVTLELHGKIIFDDEHGVVPHDAPLLIWNDPVRLPWTDDERARFATNAATHRLLDEFPAGIHVRSSGVRGDRTLQIIWTYDTSAREMIWPPEHDPHYAEILIRGLSRMIPAFCAYHGRAARARVDGGYYCKTPENRPIVGPLPVDGAYVIAALSGFGVMASQAAAEIVAAQIAGDAAPAYARAFRYGRHSEPEYQRIIREWGAASGQL
ncbi:MAG: NAD(P)/FAD-dependent oxidoreductase [bacterium]